MDLNDQMTIDHVVCVRKDGIAVDAVSVYAPEITCDYSGPFSEAQILDEHERAMIEYAASQGWTIQTGWSYQNSGRYNGPIMHESEVIGGSLENHIRETPGLWVACSVELHPGEDDPEYKDGNGESEPAGWVLAFRELEQVHYGESTPACGDRLSWNPTDSCTTTISEVTCSRCVTAIHKPVDMPSHPGTTVHANGLREWDGGIITNF